jgi:DNA-binding response OmpR family regulator
MTARLLIVDKDKKYAEWLRHHLGVLYAEATVRAMTPDQFDIERETLTYDDFELVLLAAAFGEHPDDPKAEGIVLLRYFRSRPNFPAVLAIAEEGNELTAVRALQLGAVDYLPRPQGPMRSPAHSPSQRPKKHRRTFQRRSPPTSCPDTPFDR